MFVLRADLFESSCCVAVFRVTLRWWWRGYRGATKLECRLN